MHSRLIIIRGNSGSGKSTIAKKLQLELGSGTMLVSQVVLRRDVLRAKDGPENPSIQLIYDTAKYGNKIGYDVILEGILTSQYYGKMLQKLLRNFDGRAFVYYLDIPFDETVKRHKTKPNAADFGEAEMRKWRNDKDYLHTAQEKLFDETAAEKQILETILSDIDANGSRPAH